MIKSLIVKVLAHKLAIAAIAATVADVGLTNHAQQRNAYLPPAGVRYVAADGLERVSMGERQHELNPLLGPHPGPLRVSFTVPLDTLAALLINQRHPRASRDLLIYAAVSHAAGAVSNLRMPPVMPRPVCLIGQAGCQPLTVDAWRPRK